MYKKPQITLGHLNSLHLTFKKQAQDLLKSKGIDENQDSLDLIIQQLLKNYMVSFK